MERIEIIVQWPYRLRSIELLRLRFEQITRMEVTKIAHR